MFFNNSNSISWKQKVGEIINKTPSDKIGYSLRCYALFAVAPYEFEAAIEIAEQASSYDKKQGAIALSELAYLAYSDKNLEIAIKLATSAFQLHPESKPGETVYDTYQMICCTEKSLRL